MVLWQNQQKSWYLDALVNCSFTVVEHGQLELISWDFSKLLVMRHFLVDFQMMCGFNFLSFHYIAARYLRWTIVTKYDKSRRAQITMKRKKIRLNLLKSMAGTWKKMKKLYCSPVMRRRLEEPRGLVCCSKWKRHTYTWWMLLAKKVESWNVVKKVSWQNSSPKRKSAVCL